ncbi:hypothetical protein K523DRAFT_230934 [Schizophyllum commune Tattone D]|nr:hypothetical protein K525DRAFT_276967 [Schizophyllum commune Loenen D]KAI5834269.1 hypothetical protein K523DRAFT_230934 [Schizophyllum commune Tattone D]
MAPTRSKQPKSQSKGTKAKGAAGGTQTVWKATIVANGPSDFAFTENVTPQSYSSDAAWTQYKFEPYSRDAREYLDARRERSHQRKRSVNHIPRPPNAFIIFRSSFIKAHKVSKAIENSHANLSKIVAAAWKQLPPAERTYWYSRAADATKEHHLRFPDYQFQPRHLPSYIGGKRQVRDMAPIDEERIQKITELIAEGLTDDALDKELQAWESSRVKPAVTRFEPPVTASAFRRSSSAPPEETEHIRRSNEFLQLPDPIRRPSTVEPEDRSAVARFPPVPKPQSFGGQDQPDPQISFAGFSFTNTCPPPKVVEVDPLTPVAPNEAVSLSRAPATPYSPRCATASSPISLPSPAEYSPGPSQDMSSPIAPPSPCYGASSPAYEASSPAYDASSPAYAHMAPYPTPSPASYMAPSPAAQPPYNTKMPAGPTYAMPTPVYAAPSPYGQLTIDTSVGAPDYNTSGMYYPTPVTAGDMNNSGGYQSFNAAPPSNCNDNGAASYPTPCDLPSPADYGSTYMGSPAAYGTEYVQQPAEYTQQPAVYGQGMMVGEGTTMVGAGEGGVADDWWNAPNDVPDKTFLSGPDFLGGEAVDMTPMPMGFGAYDQIYANEFQSFVPDNTGFDGVKAF